MYLFLTINFVQQDFIIAQLLTNRLLKSLNDITSINMMNDLPASMDYLQRYNSHKLAAALPEPLLSRYYRQQALQ